MRASCQIGTYLSSGWCCNCIHFVLVSAGGWTQSGRITTQSHASTAELLGLRPQQVQVLQVVLAMSTSHSSAAHILVQTHHCLHCTALVLCGLMHMQQDGIGAARPACGAEASRCVWLRSTRVGADSAPCCLQCTE